jgi:chromate transporter
MKDDAGSTLMTLLLYFGLLSIAAVGGGNSAIPEIHRQAVEVSGWMTEREFVDIFAISTAAPGPNFLISTLIGYHVAGPLGGLAATIGMCGPSSVLAYYVSGTWEKFKYARWRIAVQAGLIPVSVGLIGAAGLIVAQAVDKTWVAVAITVATMLITFFTRLNPVWLFLMGGALGLAGLV